MACTVAVEEVIGEHYNKLVRRRGRKNELGYTGALYTCVTLMYCTLVYVSQF